MTRKRTISLLLALCLTFALAMPAFAETTSNTEPCDGNCGHVVQVFVRGFLRELYYDYGTDAQREAFLLLHLLMTDQGESRLPIDKFWQHSDFAEDHRQMDLPEYEFLYDYRMGAEEIASDLNDFIEALCDATGHATIALTGMSQGTSIVMSYVAVYGTDRLETLILINGSYQGDVMLGELLINSWGLSIPATLNFIQSLLPPSAIVAALFDVLRNLPLMNLKTRSSGEVAGPLCRWLYNIFIMNLIGHIPAIWTFVPDGFYKDLAMPRLDADKYENLRNLANWYFDNVMDEIPNLLEDALAAGVKVAIIAAYGKAPIPLTGNATYQTDMIIDTANMSGGATCAPVGQILPPSTSLYRSPDGIIDAATCIQPNRTWFIKYNGHDFLPSEALRQEIIYHNGDFTINTMPETYPQFLRLTDEGGTVPLDEDEVAPAASLSEAFANLLNLIQVRF